MSVSLRCYSTSLGCPKNRVDTERLLGSLGVALVPIESTDEAELVFINTCAFIQPATEESVRTIAQAIADIEELPKRPLLAVAGCLVGRYHAEDLAPELPEVDLWLDNSDLEAWPAMLARKLGLPEPTVPGRILSTGPSYAWLKISDGCRHACSFCAIPNIRGGHRSHCKDMIVHEARALLDQGVNIAFDTIGKCNYQPDVSRADWLSRLCAEGYDTQIVMSMDITRRSNFADRGGVGYSYLLDTFAPLASEAGVPDRAWENLLYRNALRIYKGQK